jgi:ferredoxin-type protein NapH
VPDRRRPATPRWLRYRFWVQLGSLILANSYFLSQAKGFCYPVLNCWSCPSANFACPIGALGNASISARHGLFGGRSVWAVIPLYVLGTLMFFTAFFGRMMCGWLCPFGWLQEQVARLRRNKWALPMWTGYFRYLVLVVLVLIVPYLTGSTWFCKLCPQGALEGGLLQPLLHPVLRAQVQGMWWLKQAILVVTLVAMVFIRRPFCGLACPLGALFSLFHRHSAWRIRYDVTTCTNCEWCVRKCPQGIDPRIELNGHRCVGCLECQKCPWGAIESRPVWRADAQCPAAPAGPTDPPTPEGAGLQGTK